MLLAPLVKEYHPQFLGSVAHLKEALTLFTKVVSPSTTFVGYNSLGAFSTINHLHFQIFNTQSIDLERGFYTEAVRLDPITQSRH